MEKKEVIKAQKKPNFAVSITSGFASSFNARKIIRENKGLKRYFIIPFILNLILLTGIFYLSAAYLFPLIMSIIPQGDAWYISALKWIITPLFFVFTSIIIVIFYSITGNIITAPFNDPLSAKVEAILTGVESDEKFSISLFIADIIRMTANIIKLLFIFAFFFLIIMLLNLIPVIGSIGYAVLSFLGTAFFLGFNFFDFPLERRKFSFSQKFRIIWKYKFLTIGLGCGFLIISLIPILGFLGLNLGAIGATALFVEYIKPELESK